MSQRNSGGSGQANGTSSSPSSGVSSQVTSSNGSTAAAVSVKAALAAIQAGQLSLNQVALQSTLTSVLIFRMTQPLWLTKIGYHCLQVGHAQSPGALFLSVIQLERGADNSSRFSAVPPLHEGLSLLHLSPLHTDKFVCL